MQSAEVPYGEHNPAGHTLEEILGALTGTGVLHTFDDVEGVSGLTVVIPDQGEESLLERMIETTVHLKLFANDVTDGLSAAQIEALTEASFTEASFVGYSAIALTNDLWTITQGDPCAAVCERQTFTSTANQAAETLYGYYVTTTLGRLLWFEEFTSSVSIDSAGQYVRVTPRLTLADTGD